MKTAYLLVGALLLGSGPSGATTIEPATQASASTDAPSRKIKQEKIPGFTTFASLPSPVSGIKFKAPSETISSTADIDLSLAFVLATISKFADEGFTGSGGGKGYLPTSKAALLAPADSAPVPTFGETKRNKTLTEWQYSAKFDDASQVKLLNVMVRDLKARSNEPELGTTRIYEIVVSGSNDALVFSNITRKH